MTDATSLVTATANPMKEEEKRYADTIERITTYVNENYGSRLNREQVSAVIDTYLDFTEEEEA
jgi:hypothetical protein